MTDFNFDLLDDTIDNLADYVPFAPAPKGTYTAFFDWEADQIGDSKIPSVRIKFKIKEVIELAEKDAIPPAEGKEVLILFMMLKRDGTKNEISEGQLKEVVKALQPTFGGDKIRETLDAAKGGEVAVTFGVRVSKQDADVKNNTLKALVVPE